MSSKAKKIIRRRPVNRAQLFPNKSLKELMAYDMAAAVAKRQIEAAFPNPVDRLNYLNSLAEGLEKERHAD